MVAKQQGLPQPRRQDNQGPRQLAWTFVDNNPTIKPEEWAHGYEYLVYQLEQAPDTGTKHHQGFVIFKQRQRLTSLKKLNKRIHWKPCDNKRGGVPGAIKYCTKEETRLEGPFEFGTRPAIQQTKGKRNDILLLRDAIRDEQADDRQLFTNDNTAIVMARYPQLATRIRFAFDIDQRTEQTYALVFWGLPRTGKTTAAIDYCKERGLTYYTPPQKQNDDNNLWWDGYQQQNVVIINEMSGAYMKPSLYLQLIDKSACPLPCKGGTVSFNSRLIIFTSNQKPSTWWSEQVLAQPQYAGVKRRLMEPLCYTRFFDKVFEEEITPALPDELIPTCGIRDTTAFINDVVPTPTGARLSTFRLSSNDVIKQPHTGHTINDLGKFATGPPEQTKAKKRPRTDDSTEYFNKIKDFKKSIKKPFA